MRDKEARFLRQVELDGPLDAGIQKFRMERRIEIAVEIRSVIEINGGRLTSKTFGAQQNEAAIHIKIANRNMTITRPVSVRVC
jgi:hypothetical protein